VKVISREDVSPDFKKEQARRVLALGPLEERQSKDGGQSQTYRGKCGYSMAGMHDNGSK